MKTYIFSIVLIFSMVQMTWSQSRSERKAAKLEIETTSYQQTKALLDGGAFFFNAEWMLPRNGNQVNLIDNPGYITFSSKERINMYLPYFGIVRIGGGLHQSAAIKHKGEISSYKIVHNDKKRQSSISFTVKTSQELYDISMNVYSNGSSSIFISSSKRDAIRYRGAITELEKDTLTEY